MKKSLRLKRGAKVPFDLLPLAISQTGLEKARGEGKAKARYSGIGKHGRDSRRASFAFRGVPWGFPKPDTQPTLPDALAAHPSPTRPPPSSSRLPDFVDPSLPFGTPKSSYPELSQRVTVWERRHERVEGGSWPRRGIVRPRVSSGLEAVCPGRGGVTPGHDALNPLLREQGQVGQGLCEYHLDQADEMAPILEAMSARSVRAPLSDDWSEDVSGWEEANGEGGLIDKLDGGHTRGKYVMKIT
ncbi:hypothetical protein THAOC_03399 [Thalassiosira oceanica]|uniref:Uncharacterized protein n=1 Tax=Thalassiosira oceanica TaxID=159749 RepID=K0TPU3_THAOC|nr:hypothetical protein THAOC_03399 [Thalassiosira oceanica]|eukprot:EJK74897.1 hypothetical protein THAOC_03399 [Thalassiosira oceanica]